MSILKLRKDEAAIEGLPLYLLIIVIVAGLGLVLALGLFSGGADTNAAKAIGGLSVNPNVITTGPAPQDQPAAGSFTLSFTVSDDRGTPVVGAVVSIQGPVTSPTTSCVTTGPGTCTINGQATVPAGQATSSIEVRAEKGGLAPKTTTVIVRRP